MSDPSGVPSALGIEAVEWIAEGGENLTVRVTGRWRRRRPAWSGQPTLVVEAPGRRYRFPAMPEPPSLSGAGPGMWRISFSVPAALAPELGGRTWLQFGSVAVPLPSAVEPPGASEADESTDSATAPAWPARTDPEPAERWTASDEATDLAQQVPTDGLARRAEEAEAAVDALTGIVRDLERDLTAARERADELAAELGAETGNRRTAQQREHAERALRLDLARRLAVQSRETQRAREAYGQLASAEARVRELEMALEAARRRIDEAEQAAAAATIARERAERDAAGLRHGAEEQAARLHAAESARLTFEAGLQSRRAAAPARLPREPVRLAQEPARATPAPAPATTAWASGRAVTAAGELAADEIVPGSGVTALVAALRAELDLRARAEATLRARALEAESRMGAHRHLARATGETLSALRRELHGLRDTLISERAARVAAEHRTSELERALRTSRARSRVALTAITELRGALASLSPPTSPAPAPARSAVEPDRLTQALARLREQVTALEPATAQSAAPAGSDPARPASPVSHGPRARGPAQRVTPVSVRQPAPGETTRDWLAAIFRELVSADPDRAGRLLVDLLPAQRAVISEPIDYDLVLGGAENAIRVTAGDGPVQIVTGEPARSPSDVAFQVVGDHAALARMLVAGPLRRRFGRGVARIRGRRSGVGALDALVGARLGLAELHRLGVRLEPRTAMTVIAGLIDPALTARESFTLAYAAPGVDAVYLLIRAGARPEVTGVRPAGRIAVVVTGRAGSLEQVLTGAREPAAIVTGDEWPLALLRKWIKSAQSG